MGQPDLTPPRTPRFVRKFAGPNCRLNIRLDAHRKRKLDAYAQRLGLEVSDLVRSWLHPQIDALPEPE